MAAASTEDIELEEDEYVPTEEVVARIKQLADVRPNVRTSEPPDDSCTGILWPVPVAMAPPQAHHFIPDSQALPA
jgi:hypothetical protein